MDADKKESVSESRFRPRRIEDPMAELARLIGPEDPFADFYYNPRGLKTSANLQTKIDSVSRSLERDSEKWRRIKNPTRLYPAYDPEGDKQKSPLPTPLTSDLRNDIHLKATDKELPKDNTLLFNFLASQHEKMRELIDIQRGMAAIQVVDSKKTTGLLLVACATLIVSFIIPLILELLR